VRIVPFSGNSTLIVNSIQLHNFMSYADASLDLSGLPVVCFTGINGAGKSALLDALTWALWEEARAGADELVRLGQKQMWVEVEFLHEKRLYRVRRARQKQVGRSGGKGLSKGTLDFQVEESPGLWRSLTAATVRQTNENIIRLLSMDFDTFINSAYLKQGRSEEFTLRPPQERKQVLSEILGLALFDAMQEESRMQIKLKKGQLEAIQHSISQLERLEAEEREINEDFTVGGSRQREVVENLSALESGLASLYERLQEGKLAAAALRAHQEELSKVEAQLLIFEQEKKELFAHDFQLNSRFAALSQIQEELDAFNLVRKNVEKLDELYLEVMQLQDSKNAGSASLANLKSRLEVQLENLSHKEKALIEEESRLEAATAKEKQLAKNYEEYRALLVEEAQCLKREDAYHQLTRRIKELEILIGEAKMRLEIELVQKEALLNDFTSLTLSQAGLLKEGEALNERKDYLDRLETEFELVEKKGLAIRMQMESNSQKIEELKVRQHENLEKVRELSEHEHSPLCPLCSALIVDRARVIERYLEQNELMNKEISQCESNIGSLEEERLTLRKSYAAIKHELASRQDLDRQIGQYNERHLAVERSRLNFVKTQEACANLQTALAGDNYAQVERESLIALKAQLLQLDFDPVTFSNLQAQIRLKRYIEARYGELTRDLERLKQVQEELPQIKKEKALLQAELAGENYGEQERRELQTVLLALHALNYDAVEHSAQKKRLSELFAVHEKTRELNKIVAEKPVVEKQLLRVAANLEDYHKKVVTLSEVIDNLKAGQEELEALESAASGLKANMKDVQEEAVDLGRKLAVLESRSIRLAQELAQVKNEHKLVQELREEIEDLRFLAEAFGKKGIQAAIIENAIPEIESEANSILGRLTENRMHVALLTQTKNKSGTIMETLDIVIGDEVGTRNYELYSGGEAFKVNFALRIALSRLLARRAGAQLETLIIDEGFGSQDDSSRDKLVRAIQLIQQDFSRVLIITHMQDVKEMFPVQIHVSKEQGISTLQLVS
jgi:exonuclease SbcC